MNCVLSILILSTACSVAYSGGCIYAKFTPEHTLCKPPNTQCNLLANTVTNDDKNLIIKLHNDYRSKVASGQETTGGQPKAADMKQLEWDSNLVPRNCNHRAIYIPCSHVHKRIVQHVSERH
uniref:U25-Liphistoxin-Lm1g_1 n=1 Tax=Liphistius malayanus TaxID=1203467 RepID=A0A482Z8X2_9ARAC